MFCSPFSHVLIHTFLCQVPAYLSGNPDDADISAFVQDIDAHKPLSSGRESPVGPGAHTRTSTIHEESESARSSDLAIRQRTMSMPMLTTESAVGEQLQDMHAAFLASIEGLGSRGGAARREASGSTDRTATGAPSTARRPLVDPIAYTGVGRREGPLGDSAAGGAGDESPSSQQDSGVASATGRVVGLGLPLPPAYVRPRLSSTGSGFSIASEEVIGRMDPELGGSDERRNERGPLGS